MTRNAHQFWALNHTARIGHTRAALEKLLDGPLTGWPSPVLYGLAMRIAVQLRLMLDDDPPDRKHPPDAVYNRAAWAIAKSRLTTAQQAKAELVAFILQTGMMEQPT